jgi:hypothetical protein
MASRDPFEVVVSCGAASAGHGHVLVIAEDEWISFGAMPSRPVTGGMKRQIEFVCPVSGERRTAEFEPPPGYKWPFSVVSIE